MVEEKDPACIITIPEVEYKKLETTKISPREAFETQIESPKKIQSVFKTTKTLISTRLENAFLSTCRVAYNSHQRLILNPADLWQLIVQGFGKHVNLNAEELRAMFVDFDGKKEIKVVSDMVYQKEDNNWETVFPMFSQKIKENIGEELHTLLLSEFTTTTPIDYAVSEIAIMHSMQKYFSFANCFMCGFPSFKLEGTVEDWELLITKTLQLNKYKLEWWISKLVPILTKILESVQGNVDIKFWKSFYRQNMASGGDTLHGWIINFFPYMKEDKPNPYLDMYFDVGKSHWGADAGEFPLGLCKVPFKWEYPTKEYDMELLGGFVGTYQEGEYLRPAVGWAVKDA